MDESLEELDLRIDALRAQIRRALLAQDREQARVLRAGLRQVEAAWHALADEGERDGPAGLSASPARASGSGDAARGPAQAGPPAARRPGAGGVLLPLRKQVHQALALLGGPAAPRLISAVHEAFFAGAIAGSRLTSLRRDEERSLRTAPFARPYYLCAALTADFLSPVRGLLAVSTWPMETRVIGSLSPRVDYLTAAIRIAESFQRVPEPGPAAARLLWRMAANVPGETGRGRMDAAVVAEAAWRAPASRARQRLDDVQQLFGARLGTAPRAQTGA